MIKGRLKIIILSVGFFASVYCEKASSSMPSSMYHYVNKNLNFSNFSNFLLQASHDFEQRNFVKKIHELTTGFSDSSVAFARKHSIVTVGVAGLVTLGLVGYYAGFFSSKNSKKEEAKITCDTPDTPTQVLHPQKLSLMQKIKNCCLRFFSRRNNNTIKQEEPITTPTPTPEDKDTISSNTGVLSYNKFNNSEIKLKEEYITPDGETPHPSAPPLELLKQNEFEPCDTTTPESGTPGGIISGNTDVLNYNKLNNSEIKQEKYTMLGSETPQNGTGTPGYSESTPCENKTDEQTKGEIIREKVKKAREELECIKKDNMLLDEKLSLLKNKNNEKQEASSTCFTPTPNSTVKNNSSIEKKEFSNICYVPNPESNPENNINNILSNNYVQEQESKIKEQEDFLKQTSQKSPEASHVDNILSDQSLQEQEKDIEIRKKALELEKQQLALKKQQLADKTNNNEETTRKSTENINAETKEQKQIQEQIIVEKKEKPQEKSSDKIKENEKEENLEEDDDDSDGDFDEDGCRVVEKKDLKKEPTEEKLRDLKEKEFQKFLESVPTLEINYQNVSSWIKQYQSNLNKLFLVFEAICKSNEKKKLLQSLFNSQNNNVSLLELVLDKICSVNCTDVKEYKSDDIRFKYEQKNAFHDWKAEEKIISFLKDTVGVDFYHIQCKDKPKGTTIDVINFALREQYFPLLEYFLNKEKNVANIIFDLDFIFKGRSVKFHDDLLGGNIIQVNKASITVNGYNRCFKKIIDRIDKNLFEDVGCHVLGGYRCPLMMGLLVFLGNSGAQDFNNIFNRILYEVFLEIFKKTGSLGDFYGWQDGTKIQKNVAVSKKLERWALYFGRLTRGFGYLENYIKKYDCGIDTSKLTGLIKLQKIDVSECSEKFNKLIDKRLTPKKIKKNNGGKNVKK